MTSNTKHEEWEWQELTWPDTLTPDAVHATLEHLAAAAPRRLRRDVRP